MTDPRRTLPSVGALLESDELRPLLDRLPRPMVADAVRAAIDAARHAPSSAPQAIREWADAVAVELDAAGRRSLKRVLNATGVVLHTNLGRAPLADTAIDAVQDVAASYSNLEYDLDRGARGSRYTHCVSLLTELTGAEDAVVVNNCAAALVLVLNTVAEGRESIVSRGELVEIGGSFRIPDIMARSGTRLREVGTTNRTHRADYEQAIGSATAALVKVHRSNFTIDGFVAEVGAAALSTLARERDLAFVYDVGSGLLLSLDEFGLHGEPTVRDAVGAGATLVTFSADKLLGGPQAGIIVGDRVAMSPVRSNPLLRAARVDKMTLAALEATLSLYREPRQALEQIPVLAMLTASYDAVRARAEVLAERLRAGGARAVVVDADAAVGGGAFPNARLRSAAVAVDGNVERMEQRLRTGNPPIIARVADNRLLLDPRTVDPRDEALLVDAVVAASTAS